MATITDTETYSRPTRGRGPASDQRPRRRRLFARAFALGAATVAISFTGAYVALGHGIHDGATTAGQTAASSPSASTAGSAPRPVAYQHGAWVVTLQRDLAQLNYYEGPIDGVLGPGTHAAVANFQTHNGLVADGIAGPRTIALINKQLITGDSQMGGSGLPSKPASPTTATPTVTHPVSGTTTTTTGTGSAGAAPIATTTPAGSTTTPAATTTTRAGTTVAP